MVEDMDMTKVKSVGKGKIKSILKKIFILLLILILIATGGFLGHRYFFASKPGVVAKSELPEELLIFAFKIMPDIHADVVAISDEIQITETEIKRIEAIEKQFPDQKKITDTEKKIWEKNLSELTKFRIKHENKIQDIYVSYSVNTETGLKLIEENKKELKKTAGELITPSKSLTDKIRAIEEAKSFMDKLKEKVF